MTRVAAYCRVSTDTKDQQNSFESQNYYFSHYINSRPDWTLYEIYADEGITGTTTADREGFLKMIGDAQNGKFDLILTKEVSRFSRNLLDAVAYTRLLKSLGIGVVFLNDGISTLDPDAELRLGIMASIAQEESRKTSERVKWGQQRKMERGVVFGRSLLGYDVRCGVITVEPKGAETVRMIFDLAAREGLGIRGIADVLTRRDIITAGGGNVWSGASVLKILKNEKYCGDLRQRKTVTTDFLTHKKTKNKSESDMIYIRNHHVPIIERELWEKVQDQLHTRSHASISAAGLQHERRSLTSGSQSSGSGSRYLLSGRVSCAVCGAFYLCRTRKRRDGVSYRVWRCPCRCTGALRQIREDVICRCIRAFIGSLGEKRMLSGFENVLEYITDYSGDEKAAAISDIAAIENKLVRLADAFISGDIDRNAYLKLTKTCNDTLGKLKGKLIQLEAMKTADVAVDMFSAISALFTGNDGDANFYLGLVERVVILNDGSVDFSFCGMAESLHAVLR